MSSGSASAVAMSPGSVLATRYLVERELGVGGMATVLQVKDLRTDRVLALKVLKPDVAAHPEAVERFRREGEFLLGLKHPALIAVEAIGQLSDGRLFLAMELLSGETLGERIRRGRLSPVELSPLLAGVAVGLDAAHKAGVVHRDLKPDNIFLSTPRPGMSVQVKLLDFGISKIDGRASLTRTGQVLGTPRYMAPEQLRGEDDLDQRIDVYALGVILYEALAGTPAFPSTQPSELIVSILHARYTPLRAVRPDVWPELEAIVARAMSKSRQARFASAVELAQAWFDVVHRNDGPQGVRAGVSTNVLGSLVDSLRPAPGLTPDDLRPATFREFEARYVAANATRHIDAVSEAPRLAAQPGMGSPDRTTPAHAVSAVAASPIVPAAAPALAASKRFAGEMPVYTGAPLASLVGGDAAELTDPPPPSTRSPGAFAATVPAEVARAAIAEDARRRAAGQSAAASTSRDRPESEARARAAVEPTLDTAEDALVPTRRPWALLILGLLLVLGLFFFGVYGLFSYIRRNEGAAPRANSQRPRIPSIPAVSIPAATPTLDKADAGAGASLLDAGAAAVVPVDAAVAPTPVPVVDEHHHHASTEPSPSNMATSTGTTSTTGSTSTDPWTSHDGTSMTTPTTAASGSELLSQARQALSVGDSRHCIELATEAIAAGVDSSVYRVRGDCYRALGDGPHALRSYQRFCTLAPNSSQVDVVRRLAADLGGTCP